MTTISKPILATVGGLLAAALTVAPAAAAQAGTARAGFAGPGTYEWWFSKWQVQQDVWPLTEGAGVTVAVLDSGVQASVPDLRGVVLHGADMTAESTDGQTDLVPGGGHGTGVASLIAGQGHGPGIVGLAPRAKILPVTVATGTVSVLNNPDVLAEGIRYAVAHGAQVINMSVGYPTGSAASCDQDMQDAVTYALDHNVVLVAGSGDEGKTGTAPVAPASCAGVLAVGGVEPDGSLWSGSTQQSYVAIAAPGDQVYVTGADGRLYVGEGTSFSSPLVAAAAALIRSRYPSMPWYTVDQRIIATAIPEGNPVPNDGYGYGILDLPRAVNASAYPVPASAPNPVYAKFLAWLVSPEGQLYASQNGGPGTRAGLVRSARGDSHAAGIPGTLLLAAGLSALTLLAVTLARSRGTLRRAAAGQGEVTTRSPWVL